MSVMIESENLGRHFGPIKAVDGISFQVKKGEVLGFLGPNGAGKSTTMKMLSCFLTPSFGTAKVCGYDVVTQSRDVRARMGYLPENAPLYGEMEVLDFLSFVAEVRGLESNQSQAAIDRVIALTGLDSVLSQRIETLSKGFKRRVGLAQALVHDPEILILDEPTDGLDPNQKHEVRCLINSMAKDKSIILSTHILEEVDAVCTRVVIIAQGKIVADESPEALKRRSKAYGAVIVTFSKMPGDGFMDMLRRLPGVKEVSEQHYAGEKLSYVLLPDKGSSLLATVVKEAENQKWPLADLRMETGQLDDVFHELTQ
jgi:ABC-2 type transport system ATP-binding protein